MWTGTGLHSRTLQTLGLRTIGRDGKLKPLPPLEGHFPEYARVESGISPTHDAGIPVSTFRCYQLSLTGGMMVIHDDDGHPWVRCYQRKVSRERGTAPGSVMVVVRKNGEQRYPISCDNYLFTCYYAADLDPIFTVDVAPTVACPGNVRRSAKNQHAEGWCH